MRDLGPQISVVNEQNVAYITLLMGANDVCTRTVGAMTSIEDFRSQFEEAMATLSASSPRARIYVVSIPNVYRGASERASIPPERYRSRQAITVGRDTPRRLAISEVPVPSPVASTMRARTATPAEIEGERVASYPSVLLAD